MTDRAQVLLIGNGSVGLLDHPTLDVALLYSELTAPLGTWSTPPEILEVLAGRRPGVEPAADDLVRQKVRALLRTGGFKPSGRNKPASEYLRAMAATGEAKSINLAVDILNACSLTSGLPISVIDLDRAEGPFTIEVAPPESSYIFNPAGQEIRLDGLLCFFDHQGPCANAVKDSQRTKTSEETQRMLSVIWGTKELPGRTERARAWYEKELESVGCRVETIIP